MKFSEIMEKLQNAIGLDSLGACIAWTEENRGNAFSKTIDRFEQALLHPDDTPLLERESQLYYDACMRYIADYKQHKVLDEMKQVKDLESFLESL